MKKSTFIAIIALAVAVLSAVIALAPMIKRKLALANDFDDYDDFDDEFDDLDDDNCYFESDVDDCDCCCDCDCDENCECDCDCECDEDCQCPSEEKETH